MVTLNKDIIKRVVAGVDWGFIHPGVLQVWALDGDARMYRVYEVYHTRKTIDWWIERAKEARAHFGIEVFVADPAEPAYIQQFNDAGLPTVPGPNPVGPGIQLVAQRLRPQEDGRPRIFFLRDVSWGRDPELEEQKKPCSTEEEMDAYIWSEVGGKKKGEEPVKENDHGCDACRYACAYLDGWVPFSQPVSLIGAERPSGGFRWAS